MCLEQITFAVQSSGHRQLYRYAMQQTDTLSLFALVNSACCMSLGMTWVIWHADPRSLYLSHLWVQTSLRRYIRNLKYASGMSKGFLPVNGFPFYHCWQWNFLQSAVLTRAKETYLYPDSKSSFTRLFMKSNLKNKKVLVEINGESLRKTNLHSKYDLNFNCLYTQPRHSLWMVHCPR